MKITVILFVMSAATYASAEFRWKTVTHNPEAPLQENIALVEPTWTADMYPDDYEFPDVPFKYWKKVGNDWVAMTEEEQAAVDAAEQAAIDAKKSAEQKTAENAFFTLTETILAAVEDERAGQTPPVKLSFSEINALIKTIQGTDPMAAINFSLELLAVDAELKRFDILWWDKASKHEIGGE